MKVATAESQTARGRNRQRSGKRNTRQDWKTSLTRESVRRSWTRQTGRLDAFSYASRFYEAIDTAVSLSCAILLRYGEHEQLARKSIQPTSYVNPSLFYRDYQAVKLLSKYPYLRTGIDTGRVATLKFLECEDVCRQTNERFRSLESQGINPDVQSILHRTVQKVSLILGDVPSLEDIDLSFGPGAAYGVRGDTSSFTKLNAELECTHDFTHILEDFLQEVPGWIREGPATVKLVEGSEYAVVPKDAKTDRPINIEPLLNGMVQRGYGKFIRGRLKRFGVDLDDQTINQRLAQDAMRKGLATVDFSSASDTISSGLVLHLLPIDWYLALDTVRSKRVGSKGVWINLQKFSAMGNGYTFELETLLFYCLAAATCEFLGVPYQTRESLSVYGDDVIIPAAAFEKYAEVAEVCGFSINKEKSYSDGLFYESCGHDFFDGQFVRPLFLRKQIKELDHAFIAANNVIRFFNRLARIPSHDVLGSRPIHWGNYRDLYAWIVGCVPKALRLYGPEGYGDGHLIGGKPRNDCRHATWDGWYFYTYSRKAREVEIPPISDTRYPLYLSMLGRSEERRDLKYTIRGEGRLSKRRMFCHFTWQNAWYGTAIVQSLESD